MSYGVPAPEAAHFPALNAGILLSSTPIWPKWSAHGHSFPSRSRRAFWRWSRPPGRRGKDDERRTAHARCPAPTPRRFPARLDGPHGRFPALRAAICPGPDPEARPEIGDSGALSRQGQRAKPPAGTWNPPRQAKRRAAKAGGAGEPRATRRRGGRPPPGPRAGAAYIAPRDSRRNPLFVTLRSVAQGCVKDPARGRAEYGPERR